MDISLKFSPETLPESLLLGLLGMTVVMLALVLLMAAIKGQSWLVSKLTAGKHSAVPVAQPVAAAPAPVAVAAAVDTAVDLHDVDDKTAAMIMAIVADETDIPLEELRFTSIKRA
ncbi:MAG: OadG family transporter subunit [Eubacteriales bacterium]|nr:OadG family transporter subunit [Eubacteriales bacterium]